MQLLYKYIQKRKLNFCKNKRILCKWHLVPDELYFEPLASDSSKTSDTYHIYSCLNILECQHRLHEPTHGSWSTVSSPRRSPLAYYASSSFFLR